MKSYIYIFLIVLLGSCKHKEFSTVKISANDTDYLFEVPRSKGKLFELPEYNDGFYEYKNIPNGRNTFVSFSLLAEDIEKTFDLQDDLTLNMQELYPRFTKSDDPNLGNINSIEDTIYIGRYVSGCYVQLSEKLVLLKKDDKIHIAYFRLNNHWANYKYSLVKDTLYNLYFRRFMFECRQQYGAPLEKILNSTTSHKMYIRKGNKYYEIPDVTDWTGFNNLLKDLGVREFTDDDYLSPIHEKR